MKRNLLKAIGISFLVFVFLSWIIPAGTYSNGELVTNGTNPVGLFSLINVPVSTFMTFALYAIVFAVIGGLYGVIDKTGVLELWVEKVTTKFKKKEKKFLIFTIIFFTILSSVTGLILPLFVLVPLFAAFLLALHYDKVTVLAATVGAMLIGSVGSTYGFNITGYTKNILYVDINNQIWAKLIILVLITAALIFFVLKFSKIEKPKEKPKKVEKEGPVKEVVEKKPSPKKSTPKKKTIKKNTQSLAFKKDVKKVKVQKTVSIVPLITILSLLLVVSIVGLYNWYYSFEIEFFNDIYTSLISVKIGDYAIFEKLLGGIGQFGYWGNVEFVTVMLIAAALIGWIYRLSFGKFVEAFIAGMKKILPTAIYAALASVILSVLYQAFSSGTGSLVETMFAKTIELTGDFNVITTGLSALYGSFFYNDLYYLLSSLQAFVSTFDANVLGIAGLLIQSVYGLGMIVFPTSVILIAGLSYFDVSYKQWIKYIWKFALVVFLVLLIICAILTLI